MAVLVIPNSTFSIVALPVYPFVLVLVLVIVIERTNSHSQEKHSYSVGFLIDESTLCEDLEISHFLDYDYDYEHEHEHEKAETKYSKTGWALITIRSKTS